MSRNGPGRFIRYANRVVTLMIRMGVPTGSMALLTVPGWRSGIPRTTPVTLTPHDAGWRLASPFGEVDWVRNLRAAGRAEISARRRTVEVRATELKPEDAAPLLRESLSSLGPLARRVLGGYFEVSLDAEVEDWVAEAARHPTFVLHRIGDQTPVETDQARP